MTLQDKRGADGGGRGEVAAAVTLHDIHHEQVGTLSAREHRYQDTIPELARNAAEAFASYTPLMSSREYLATLTEPLDALCEALGIELPRFEPRRCQHDECETLLSRYNSTPFCSLHAQFSGPRGLQPTVRHQCRGNCGRVTAAGTYCAHCARAMGYEDKNALKAHLEMLR